MATTSSDACVNFELLGLSEAVLRGIKAKGYRTPSPIQAQAIPLIFQGKDIIGASQTGTGKTAAFALPVLTRLKKHGDLRCLVLEPTRELAQQVAEAFRTYSQELDLNITLLHGGVGYGRQREELDIGADIVVATPGRLLDYLDQKTFSLKNLETLIIDEADRMLDMGFIPDVYRIIRYCPRQRQSMLFSATMVPAIERLSSRVLKDPVRIAIGGGTSPAETVRHAIYPVDNRQKFDLLVAILKKLAYKSVIIFCRTKAGADIIARWLTAAHHKTVILHSDRSQKEREGALADFKSGKVEILVATDIVSRGIDIVDVSHVINYDIPQNPEDYVHRIGRTGRMKREGDAVTLVTASDEDFLNNIEIFISQKIGRKKLEDFSYNWSPILEEPKPRSTRRNRDYGNSSPLNTGRRRRR